MTSLDAFLPDILPHVPGCPADLAKLELVNTLLEFCELTGIYQMTSDPMTLVPKLAQYDIETPDNTRCYMIQSAWFQGRLLTPIAPDMAHDPYQFADVVGGHLPMTGEPKNYSQRDPGTVNFLPIPNQRYVASVTLRLVLVPLRNAATVEDFLYQEWGEVIASGARARLMLSPGKPYSNAASANIQQARYSVGRNRALLSASHGRVRSNLRVKLRKA